MDHPQTWAEALNINPNQLTRWSAEAPAGQPLLVHCLTQGHVSVDAYLRWASDTYGLACLNADFFTAACDHELVRGAHELESYSPWFFPVGRWDDVIYVACVEAPNLDDAPPGYCFLLADPRVMIETWATAMGDAEATNLTKLTSLTNISIGLDGNTAVLDGPAGLSSNDTKLFTLNLDGVSLNLDGHLAPPAPEPLNRGAEPSVDDDSDYVELDPTRVGYELAPAAPAVVAEPPAPAAPSVAPPTPIRAYAPPTPVTSAPEPAAPSVPPPAAPAPTAAPPVTLVAPTTVTPVAPAPPRATYVPSAFGAAAPPVTPLSLPSTEAGALTRTFEHLNSFYTNSCVLRRTDSTVRLYKWGLGLTPAGQGVVLDLNYPSFLRIVTRTNMPYHGYLIDSPIHREFFRGLGLNDLPACVTAVPLMVDDVLWGVLLATGEADRQELNFLAQVESVAGQLTQALTPAWRKVA